MKADRLNCVFLGLSITSAWGNGHATTYRSLLKALAARGHSLTFLERDVPWYASKREFEHAPYCDIALYGSLDELKSRFDRLVRAADVVVVGSYVPDGIAVGRWIAATAGNLTAFYDIDTPVTLAALGDGSCKYLSADLCGKYDLYLSFTGGPTLRFLEHTLGVRCARALYCSVDPSLYFPEKQTPRWDLGYLGTYAADRQPALEKLLFCAAKRQPDWRFAVAGPLYPETIAWPQNVERIDHLPAGRHRAFYNSQHFTLNLTRRDMIRAGYSPSVRLFEAAACGTPILTDTWPGLDSFFDPHREILPANSAADVASYLQMPEERRRRIGAKARRRVLRSHTAAVRAAEFEAHVYACFEELSYAKKKGGQTFTRSAAAAAI
ncbi:MAG TPA: glycosyltransferase [Bryobacteraceae bacterium]